MVQKRKKTNSTRTKKIPLTKDDIKHFEQLLRQKRNEIVGDVKEMKDEALKQSRLDASGDLSSMPIHMADIGSDTFEQEFALGIMEGERKIIREIDDALGRIKQGTYGVCEVTNKPITKARLEAKPWARYSVEYARKREQGISTELETE